MMSNCAKSDVKTFESSAENIYVFLQKIEEKLSG